MFFTLYKCVFWIILKLIKGRVMCGKSKRRNIKKMKRSVWLSKKLRYYSAYLEHNYRFLSSSVSDFRHDGSSIMNTIAPGVDSEYVEGLLSEKKEGWYEDSNSKSQ